MIFGVSMIKHKLFRKNKNKAQGMVEFALALPVFLLAVFGVIELSRFFLIYSSVYTASREAARYGSSVGLAADGFTPHDQDCSGIQRVAKDQGFLAGINISDVTVQVQKLDDNLLTSGAPVNCPTQTKMGDRILVSITATFQPILGVIPVLPITASSSRTIMKEIDMHGTPPPTLEPATPVPSPTENVNPYVEIIDDDPPDDGVLVLRDYTSGVKAINANVVDFNPDNRIHTWSLIDGDAANVAIQDTHTEDTTVNFYMYGLYEFNLEVFDGQYTGSDTIKVLANIKPDVSAGEDYELVGTNNNVCSTGSPFQLNGSASDLFGFTINPPDTTWNDSGPGAVSYDPSRDNVLNPYVTFPAPGDYSFTLSADDGYVTSTSISASVSVNFPPVVTASVEDDVPDFPAYMATFTGSATNPDGLPAPGNIVSYLWEKVSGPGDVDFKHPTSQDTTATFSARGTYQVRLIASDGCDYGYSPDVTVHVNEIPVVNAEGPVQIVPSSATTALLSGSVIDDGYPNDPTRLTHLWSGPTNVTIDNPSSLSTIIRFDGPGTYLMYLTANDGWESASDQVSVIVNTLPIVNAGTDQTIRSTAFVSLNGSASDDDVPYQSLTPSWSRVSGTGTGTVHFSNTNVFNPTVTFSRSGVYVLQLTVSDGIESSSDQVTITKNFAPEAFAVASSSIIDSGESVFLDGSDSIDPDHFPNTELSYLWSVFSGPGTVSFTDSGATDVTPTASFSTSGNYILRLRVYDGLEYDYTYVYISVNPPPAASTVPSINSSTDPLFQSAGVSS